jgi:hypothetical protein
MRRKEKVGIIVLNVVAGYRMTNRRSNEILEKKLELRI